MEVSSLGKESHASAFPERGLNALDAMNLSYFAVAALRQHIAPNERIHGIITHGGDAPNIVPKTHEGALVHPRRQPRGAGAAEAEVGFESGAVAAGCELEIDWRGHSDEVINNPTMSSVYESNPSALGRTAVPRAMVEAYAGSTDMGNVSKGVPSIHPVMGIDSLPAVNHQADFADHTIKPAGDRAIVDAAVAMARTVIDLATTPGALDRIREEFENPPPPSRLKI